MRAPVSLPVIAAFFAASASVAAATPQAELAANGGFESGDTSSWAYFGTPNSTFSATADASSGAFGGQVFNPDQTTAAVIKQANLGVGAVSSGELVTITFSAKGTFANGGVAFAEFFSELSGGGVSSSEILGGGPLNLTGAWQLFSFTAVAGSDVSGGVTLQFAVVNGANSGSLADFLVDDVSVTIPGLGVNFCAANANSLGVAASMAAQGSSRAADNDLTLAANGLAAGSFGFFLASRLTGLTSNPGGSQGNLCLSGSIGRYVGPGQIQQADSGGGITLMLDLLAVPQPTGFVAVAAGEAWSFQAWYRDSVAGQATSNFTDGLTVTFQ
ncbi:MAG: hypothetical protein P8M11_01415 [Planctomycetota bacterium]|nr:hypothetical protein [Planctomycetota bacterium]MDG1983204.1 hypothetical protein [Planctomycetota bacterium]